VHEYYEIERHISPAFSPLHRANSPRAIGRHVGSAANVLLKYGYKKANDKQRK